MPHDLAECPICRKEARRRPPDRPAVFVRLAVSGDEIEDFADHVGFRAPWRARALLWLRGLFSGDREFHVRQPGLRVTGWLVDGVWLVTRIDRSAP